MKIIIYTAVIGNIDHLWSARPSKGDVQHIAFVDAHKREVGLWGGKPPRIVDSTHSASPMWEQIVVKTEWDNRRTARHYKTLPHRYLPEHDVSIWVDGNVRLTIPPGRAVNDWLRGQIAILKHPDRRCLYDEATFCARHRKDDPRILKSQAARYRQAGMPAGWGLPETRVVIRRNTAQVQWINETWWNEIDRGSCRDQVSVPFVCWKAGVRWDEIPGRCGPVHPHGPFIYIRHKRKR